MAEGPAELSKDFQQLALNKMTVKDMKDIKFIVFDLHFLHLTSYVLLSFRCTKKVNFTVRRIETAVGIKLSSGNIFSSLLNNVELINWVELVNVTRVNVKYLFSM